MNCLHSRRLLLALARAQSAEHAAHIDDCPACARLAAELGSFERDIEDAALVPVPDALAERILVRRNQPQPMWRYAAAAMLAVAIGAAVVATVTDLESARTAEAVGPLHPAVVAIAEVADERHELAPSALSAQDIHQDLHRLGLKLKPAEPGEVNAYHLGKCRMQERGSGECDHIIVSTRELHADVMLLENYPHRDRLLVEGREMVALVSPTSTGAYIVVARSSSAAKRVEKLFVKG